MLLPTFKEEQKVSSAPDTTYFLLSCYQSFLSQLLLGPCTSLVVSLAVFVTRVHLMCNYSHLRPFGDHFVYILLKNGTWLCHCSVTKYLHAVVNYTILASIWKNMQFCYWGVKEDGTEVDTTAIEKKKNRIQRTRLAKNLAGVKSIRDHDPTFLVASSTSCFW